MKPTTNEVHDALKQIISNKDAKALNYCVNYARAGLFMEGHALEVQCLYVLSNMTHWRGEIAKNVRTTLKAYTSRKRS